MNPITESFLEVCEANFTQAVIEAKEPVLTMFWVPWSHPCKILLSVLKDIVSTSEGTVRIATVNADNNIILSMQYQIQSIPTLICFFEGLERDRIVGTASKIAILSKFRPYLDSLLNPPSSRDNRN